MVSELQLTARYSASNTPVAIKPDHRRYEYKHSHQYSGVQATSIAKRNARERNRVKQVNDGFSALRKRLPPAVVAALAGSSRRGTGNKLSKVDTLRMVVEYIRYLESLVDDAPKELAPTDCAPKSLCHEDDEGVCERLSPYTESLPSPVYSDCSSGVSVGHATTESYQQSYAYEDVFDSFAWC